MDQQHPTAPGKTYQRAVERSAVRYWKCLLYKHEAVSVR